MAADRPHPDTLITTHAGFIRAWAVQLAPFPGLADDIAQQVFAEFLASAERYDLTSDVRPLLYAMTRNIARRSWRERVQQMTPEMQALAEHIRAINETREAEPFSDDERQALRQCLEELPSRSRQLVELHYGLDLPAVKLAEQVAMRADAVRRALFRIRGALRQCIGRHLGGASHA